LFVIIEQVLDPIIEDIETDIINPALDIYNNAVDTINTIIPFFGEINDTLNNNGYPIFDGKIYLKKKKIFFIN